MRSRGRSHSAILTRNVSVESWAIPLSLVILRTWSRESLSMAGRGSKELKHLYSVLEENTDSTWNRYVHIARIEFHISRALPANPEWGRALVIKPRPLLQDGIF